MDVLRYAKKKSKAKCEKLSFLLQGEGRRCSKEEFASLQSGSINELGKIKMKLEDGFVLPCADKAEARFAELLLSSGMVIALRGQNFVLPYQKPWATKPSPYYPDFLFQLDDGKIAIVEMKSILGMCQDENIAKYHALRNYALRQGYLYAMIDIDDISFEEYLWPFPEDDVTKYFRAALASQGGFNQGNLEALLAKRPKKQGKEIRRKIASLVLQNPYLENRYCHDDPRLINATQSVNPLPYKIFS